MSNLLFDIILPPPGAKDVDKRELTYGIGNDPVAVVTVGGAELAVTGLKGAAGAEVTADLVDIDAAGNRSQPSPTLSATLVDTFPPPAPGELGIKITGQED